MDLLLLRAWFSLSCILITEANTAQLPRTIISHTDTSIKRIRLPGDHPSVQILLEGKAGNVIVVGQNQLISANFRNPQQPPTQREVFWEHCTPSGSSPKGCNYNVTVVHKREEANLVFVCGTNGEETICCDLDLSDPSPKCESAENLVHIRNFVIKEGEASALVGEDLYMTYSGSSMFVGIHKFGRKNVGPANHNKEQHFVGLVPIRQRDNPLQDKVYGFYRERNQDKDLYSGMWLPFVTQVCMADSGGPKSRLQSSWTSQMSARLFCGDPDNKQHFSELVDVAAVHAVRWQDTRVYGLFRNEWGMSAVCVYTMDDIHKVFTNSPFKGESAGAQENRPRQCVPDSTAISFAVLKLIEENSEMEDWVRPVDNSDPILITRQNYNHVYVDSSPNMGHHHPVLFLSLRGKEIQWGVCPAHQISLDLSFKRDLNKQTNIIAFYPNDNGRIHKVRQYKRETFVIAEYRPFNTYTHLLSITFHPFSRKLYVTSRSELIEMDVANCTQYGDSCEDCVLARDPYCGWTKPKCVPATLDSLQDVAHGNPDTCKITTKALQRSYYSEELPKSNNDNNIWIPSESKYFLQCPVSSLHAEYTWDHPEGPTRCSSKEQQCLLLIDNMGLKQEGLYKCESEEKGYRKTVVEQRLRLQSRAAGHSSSLVLWVCLAAVFFVLSK